MMTENSRYLPKLHLLGDSNTRNSFEESGFSSKQANRYMIIDVVNRGLNGFTSEHLRFMLQNDNTPLGSMQTATILLGSNYCVLGKLDNHHIPLQMYEENVEFITKNFSRN